MENEKKIPSQARKIPPETARAGQMDSIEDLFEELYITGGTPPPS